MYQIISDVPIVLSHVTLPMSTVISAINATNRKIQLIAESTARLSLDVFKVLDLRTLSGAVGETFVSEMSRICPELRKNPSIDGYPDLVQCTTKEMHDYFNYYAAHDSKEPFLYGGIEIKDTFGYKKPNTDLFIGEQRVARIQKRLQWKAHHQQTNHLLGLYSDYINGCPTIVAAFYSDKLEPSDWSVKAEPKGNSAMTSFSTLQISGFEKMK